MSGPLHLTDTHCHLDFTLFDEDRERVVDRARQAGVQRMINPGIDLESSRRAMDLAGQYDEVYVAVGIHPNDATQWDETSYEMLKDLAKSPKVVAIGEIGLDNYRNRAPKERQQIVFREQLRLAGEMEQPVIIHNREASADIMPFLEEWCSNLITAGSLLAGKPGVLHSFSGDEAFAQHVLDLGFFIGITGPVTFPNARGLRDLVKQIPLDRMLVETDSPFLTPQAHRGQRNEPAYVGFVVEKIAEIRQLPAAEVAEITAQNAGRLFHW